MTQSGLLFFLLFTMWASSQAQEAPASAKVPEAPHRSNRLREDMRKSLEQPPLLPRVLTLAGEKTLMVPPFGSYGNPVCDVDGNAFFHLAAGPWRDITLFELSADGGTRTYFRVPPELEKERGFASFAVSPQGKLKVLAVAADGLHVLNFKADGSFERDVYLENSTNLFGQMAIFENGSILLVGYFKADAAEKGKNYVGIFDGSGRLLRRFNEDFGTTDFSLFSKGPIDGDVAIGDDGNVYAMNGKEVIVFSSAGEILRRFPFTKPEKGQVASRINVSQGLIAISLATLNADHSGSFEYLMLDANSGQALSLYVAPPELNGIQPTCFTRSGGFSFDTVKNAQPTRVTATMQ